MGNRIWPFVLVLTMTLGCGESSDTQESGDDIGFPVFDITDGGAALDSGDADPGALEIIEPDLAQPDTVELDLVVADLTEPDQVEADLIEPDQVQADLIEPDQVQADLIEPDQVQADLIEPDQVQADLIEPDQVEPDLIEPDQVQADLIEPDQVEPDGTMGSECGDALTDVDGNTYSTVQIGSQCWMAENLNTTHDANGAPITRWCCDCSQYGGMYNWSTVMNGSSTDGAQGICPTGWHVPSDADWFHLESYIDPSMTDPNYIGWSNTTIGDQLYLGGPYGFDWITGGFSYGGNACSYNYDRIGYWTSSNDSPINAVSRFFNTGETGSNRDMRDKIFGYYIRCLKD